MSTAVTPQDERGRMLIQILNGVVYGALLYLLAVGLVLIFGLREVVNFAHGALFMVGAYLGFSVAAAGYWWGALGVWVVGCGGGVGHGPGGDRLLARFGRLSHLAQTRPDGDRAGGVRAPAHSGDAGHRDLGQGVSA